MKALDFQRSEKPHNVDIGNPRTIIQARTRKEWEDQRAGLFVSAIGASL
jgi:hypothetical protein